MAFFSQSFLVRFFQWLGGVLLSAFVLFLAFAALLPTLVSTSLGKEALLSLVNHRIPGKVSIEKVSLRWFGSQSFKGFRLVDEKDALVLEFKEFKTESSLFSMLFQPKSLTLFSLNSLQAVFTKDAQGESNLYRSLGVSPLSETWEREKRASIILKDLDAELVFDPSSLKNRHWIFTAHGRTLDGEKTGTFSIQSSFHELFFPSASSASFEEIAHFLEETGAEINVSFVDFPTPIVDRLFSLVYPSFKGAISSSLGDMMNFSFHNIGNESSLKWDLTLTSPFFQGQAEIQLIENQWRIKKSSSFQWKVTPETFHFYLPFLAKEILPLKEDANLTIQLDRFSIPILSHPFSLDWRKADIKGEINGKEMVFQKEEKKFSLQNIRFSLDHSNKQEALLGSFSAFLLKNDKLAPIKIHGSTPYFSNLFTYFLENKEEIEFQLETEEFPLSFLDLLFGTETLIVDSFGEHFRFGIDLQREKESKKIQTSLHIETENFSLPEMTFLLKNDFSLIKPLWIELSLASSLIEQVFPKNFMPHIRNNVPIQISLNKLVFPAYSDWNSFWKKIGIDLDLAAEKIHILEMPNLGNFDLSDVRLHIAGEGVPKIEANFSFKIDSQNRQFITPNVFGGYLDTNFQAKFALTSDGKIWIPDLTASMKSDLLSFQLKGKMSDTFDFSFDQPANLTYFLTNTALLDLGFIQAGKPFLKAQSPLQLSLDLNDSFSLGQNTFLTKNLKGTIQFPEISFVQETKPVASLKNGNIPFEINNENNQIKFSFQADALNDEKKTKGKVNGEIRIVDWLDENGFPSFENHQIGIMTDIQKFPTSLLNIFFKRDDLTLLLGSDLDASFQLTKEENKTLLKPNNVLLFSIVSPLLEGNGKLHMEKSRFFTIPENPIEILWQLTPEGYSILRQKFKGFAKQDDSVYLQKPAHLQLTVDELDLSFLPEKNWTENGKLNATLAIDNLSVKDVKRKQEIQLNDIQGTFLSRNIAKSIDFYLHTSGDPVKNPSTLTDFLVRGSLKNTWTPEGLLNPYSLEMNFDAEIEKLPIGMLCNLLFLEENIQNKADALIGDYADAEVHVDLKELEGAINVDIRGAYGNLSLDGRVHEGTFYLNKPFALEVSLHPHLSEHVLQNIVPLLKGAISSDHPIKISISPEGFSLPLLDYSFKKIKIEKAEIDLGKVSFQEDGGLGAVLEILKPTQSDHISVWFTPLYLTVSDGILHCERLDMFVNDLYPIATWGNIDFVQDKVKMVVGLTGTAIHHAFEINDISKTYMLQLDVQGSTSHAKIDKTKATTKISALVAKKSGGIKGKFFGTVLQMAAGDLTDPTPPDPTTFPFPWSLDQEELSDDTFGKNIEDTNSNQNLTSSDFAVQAE